MSSSWQPIKLHYFHKSYKYFSLPPLTLTTWLILKLYNTIILSLPSHFLLQNKSSNLLKFFGTQTSLIFLQTNIQVNHSIFLYKDLEGILRALQLKNLQRKSKEKRELKSQKYHKKRGWIVFSKKFKSFKKIERFMI